MSNDIGREGRLTLAIKAIQDGQITSKRKAAHTYNVPRSTLHN